MPINLGKNLNRCYQIQLPFVNYYYIINIYFNKKSTLLLFSTQPQFLNNDQPEHSGIEVRMFKNLSSSKFCEVFLKLNSYKSSTLDILNQFDGVNNKYIHYINYLFNEIIDLSKISIKNENSDKFKYFKDKLSITGFTIDSCQNNFIFVLAERQNIILNKKIVRTSGIQISTFDSLNFLSDFYKNMKNNNE